MRYLKRIHLSASGLSLALASLGNLLVVHRTYFMVLCGTASVLMITLITLKIFLCHQEFLSDLHNIDIVSVFPTYFMTIMTLSTYSSISFSGIDLSRAVWLASSVVHVCMAILFIKNYVLKFNINKVMPNWFITLVAYAVAGIAASAYGMRAYGQVLSSIGIICYFILFPLMLYRVLVINQIPENIKPVLWLFNSPVNICIVAYISAFSPANPVILFVLLLFSLFSFIMSFYHVNFKQILKNGFTPSMMAFTFPTVIFVTAIKYSYFFYRDNGYLTVDLSSLIIVMEAAAAFIVFGMFTSYAIYVLKE